MEHRHEHQWACGHGWGPPHGHPLGYEQALPPGMLLSTLNTVLCIALLAVLAWTLWRWISPHVLPMLEGLFDTPHDENPPALEILRQRYAAGEIDAATFEQMRERLEASYRPGEQQPPS